MGRFSVVSEKGTVCMICPVNHAEAGAEITAATRRVRRTARLFDYPD